MKSSKIQISAPKCHQVDDFHLKKSMHESIYDHDIYLSDLTEKSRPKSQTIELDKISKSPTYAAEEITQLPKQHSCITNFWWTLSACFRKRPNFCLFIWGVVLILIASISTGLAIYFNMDKKLNHIENLMQGQVSEETHLNLNLSTAPSTKFYQEETATQEPQAETSTSPVTTQVLTISSTTFDTSLSGPICYCENGATVSNCDLVSQLHAFKHAHQIHICDTCDEGFTSTNKWPKLCYRVEGPLGTLDVVTTPGNLKSTFTQEVTSATSATISLGTQEPTESPINVDLKSMFKLGFYGIKYPNYHIFKHSYNFKCTYKNKPCLQLFLDEYFSVVQLENTLQTIHGLKFIDSILDKSSNLTNVNYSKFDNLSFSDNKLSGYNICLKDVDSEYSKFLSLGSKAAILGLNFNTILDIGESIIVNEVNGNIQDDIENNKTADSLSDRQDGVHHGQKNEDLAKKFVSFQVPDDVYTLCGQFPRHTISPENWPISCPTQLSLDLFDSVYDVNHTVCQVNTLGLFVRNDIFEDLVYQAKN